MEIDCQRSQGIHTFSVLESIRLKCLRCLWKHVLALYIDKLF